MSGSWPSPIARSSSHSGAPFRQYALAPAFIIAITVSVSAEPASATMRIAGHRSWMRRAAATPSTSGIETSISTTSGASSAASATACSPFSASPTISSSVCRASSARTASRAGAESSQTSRRNILSLMRQPRSA
jgi:hypothetical protein